MSTVKAWVDKRKYEDNEDYYEDDQPNAHCENYWMNNQSQQVYSNEGYYQEEEQPYWNHQEHDYQTNRYNLDGDDQEEEQPNGYWENSWNPSHTYTQNWNNSQRFEEEHSYPPYPQPPQQRMPNDSSFPPRPQGQNNYQGNYQRQGYDSKPKPRAKLLFKPRAEFVFKSRPRLESKSQYSQGNYQKPYQARSNMNEQGNSSSNSQNSSMMSMMAQLMESNKRAKRATKEWKAKLDELAAENKDLLKRTTQLKQIGELPSQPDVNSLERVEAITLKSGKVLPTPQGKSSLNGKEMRGGIAKESLEVEPQAPTEEEKKEEEPILMRKYVPMVPFPPKVKQKQA
ncbi:unnamed protein product [Rhodiola kirilowii]